MKPVRPPDDPPKKRFASLHEMLGNGDDPFAEEPFWPPVLMGLALAAVIFVVVLVKHGVLTFGVGS